MSPHFFVKNVLKWNSSGHKGRAAVLQTATEKTYPESIIIKSWEGEPGRPIFSSKTGPRIPKLQKNYAAFYTVDFVHATRKQHHEKL